MTPLISEYAIIADDLTGSLDTGLQFSKKGLTTLVPLSLKPPYPFAQVLVLNTDSRNISGNLAYRKVYKIARALQVGGIYKKIDSTMRGNVGKEALAILDAQKIPRAIIVPTIPVLGRTVERGILRVHGIRLLRTPYAQDPFHPIWTSRVADLLQEETGEQVAHLGLGEVRRGPETLADKIENGHARLLTLDAVQQSDLKCIALACKLLTGRVLPCGSVGLADELFFPSLSKGKKPARSLKGPILIISASRNPTTAGQIEEARKHFRFPLVEPDLNRLTTPRVAGLEIEKVSLLLASALSDHSGAILTTTFQEHIPGKEGLIPRALGKVVVQLMGKVRLKGMVLTGGDLAMGVCQYLSSSALRIEEEVLPGIPRSTLTDGPFEGLRMVTKAGGFGGKDALWRIIQYLRGENEKEKA